MIRWIEGHAGLLGALSGAGLVLCIATLILAPIVIVRIPPDYFAHARRPAHRTAGRSFLLRSAFRVGKNALALVFLAGGLAMLVLPGPGLVTLLLAFLLLDAPGKYRLERWLVSRRLVLSPMNWLRKRAKRRPLLAWAGP